MGSEPYAGRAAWRAKTPGTAETLVAVRGCLPTAAVAIDARGTVAHWSAGARALFGHRRKDALGAAAGELLPVTGALNAAARPGDHHWLAGIGDLAGSGEAMAGRARVPAPGGARADVLWWGYPLAAPAPFRLLVLATGTARLQRQRALHGTRVVPGFGPYGRFPEGADLGVRLPRLLGRAEPEAAAPVLARIRELGCPVVEVHRPVDRDDPALAVLNAQVSGGCAERSHPPE
ncbi:PAS domain-containing protein [Streptomyces smyrnaeus]|uniref:PAS domain-containing protein n=1 Tax=Streptomyces smyrnaeus TaxID=1387713 RepID=UPI0033FCE377